MVAKNTLIIPQCIFFSLGGRGGVRSFVKARNNTLVNLFGKGGEGGEEGVVVFISQSKEIPNTRVRIIVPPKE